MTFPGGGAKADTWPADLTAVDHADLLTNVDTPLNALRAYYGTVWNAWTPALTAATTNPTLGTGGTAVGRYVAIGNAVTGWGRITFGASGTNAGSGTYSLSLPAAAHATQQVSNRTVNGVARIRCAGVYTDARLSWSSTSNLVLVSYPSTQVNGNFTAAANATPGAWTAADFIDYEFTYEAA